MTLISLLSPSSCVLNQALLDGVVDYLPNPTQKECAALDLDAGEQREVLQVHTSPLLTWTASVIGQIVASTLFSPRKQK